VYDLVRGSLSRLTFEGWNGSPLWTPDGTRVVFNSDREGGLANLYWKSADGSGVVERLLPNPEGQMVGSFSPDGKVLAFVPLRQDIWALDIDSDKPPWPLVQTRFDEYTQAFSPDGRWLAYGSNESGRREVYVVPYPGLDGRYQISTQGGAGPTWAGNGRELFYHRLENGSLKMMAVDIATEPEFRAGLPQQAFEGPYVAGAPVRSYDVPPDGQRFLMVRKGNPRELEPVTEMHLILNWTEELKRLVPTGN